MDKNLTVKTYLVGFTLSLLLTFVAYLFVVEGVLEGLALLAFILGLAFLQMLVQLIFFLHLANESKPRWNLVIFLSTASIILIVLIGSLVIMKNLDYRHDAAEDSQYLLEDEGIYK